MAPARLAKTEQKERNTFMDTFEAWLNRHAPLIVIVCMCLLIALIVCLIFILIGSCTDSGMVYNQMSNVI